MLTRQDTDVWWIAVPLFLARCSLWLVPLLPGKENQTKVFIKVTILMLRPVVCYGLKPATDGMQSAILFGSVLLKNVDFK